MRFKFKILYYYFVVKLSKWLYRKNYVLLQNKRWNIQVKKLKQSKFYEPLIKVSTLLSKLPVINKTIFMRNFDEINTCGIHLQQAMDTAIIAEHSRDFSPVINNITIGLSTGTSGNKGCFLVSENERALWVACVLDRVIGFSLHKRKVAFFLRANSNLYQSVQSSLLEFHYFDILKNIETNIETLHNLQPDIIVAQPSVLMLIANKMEKCNIRFTPTQVISIAEVLTSEDKYYLENIFRQTIHQVYQCTEGLLAATCKYGTLHFNEDFLIIEKKYVNAEKTKFHPIITDLFRTCQPIIRYELNDIVTIKESCTCGSKMLAIEQIEGRSDDLLWFNDSEGRVIKLFPDVFRRAIVLADDKISDYAVIQNSTESLGLYIHSANQDSYEKGALAIHQLLLEFNIVGVEISKIQNDPYILGTKKRRIRNECRKTN